VSSQRKWHIFLFSLLFSILLLISVKLGGTYQAFIKIKVVPINLPNEKALFEPIPQTVNVKFHGLGWEMASLYFNPNVEFELDLSKLQGKNFISLKQNLRDFLKLPPNIEAIDVEPESLKIELDDYIEKKVPVKPNVIVKCLPGYGVVGEIKSNPDSIVISGSKKILKDIFIWPTLSQEYKDVKDDIVALLPLSDSMEQIFRFSHKMVGIDVNVQMIAEQKFKDIEINVTDVPPKTYVNILPPKISITIRSGVENLSNINKSELSARISYQKLLGDSTGNVVPDIILPKGLKLIGIEPREFEYVIRKPKK
jgi:YbbR domain-containing protein